MAVFMNKAFNLLNNLKRGVSAIQMNNDLIKWRFMHSKRLVRFKNIHDNEGCFIIGNGPSLNKMDLSLLRDYNTFGLNKIYLMFDKVDLNLSYHVAVNPLVIEQSITEFEKLRCPSFLAYRTAHKLARNSGNLYYLATDSQFPVRFSFYPDISQPFTEGYTVTYVALQIAFYMGFKNVFLIGVDHNFKAVGKPNEKQLLTGEDQNHFDPRYFSNKQWHLPDLEASELSYHLAQFFYNRNGRQIYDATVDGNLQIFSKIPYEQALRMCNKKVLP